MDRPDDRAREGPEAQTPIHSPADPGSKPSERAVREEISQEVHQIYSESYGKDAGTASAFVGEGFAIVVLDGLELLPNEEFLIEKGKQDDVVHLRTQYQQATQAPLRAAVERATGRSVVGFASATSVEEPRFAAEIFKLT